MSDSHKGSNPSPQTSKPCRILSHSWGKKNNPNPDCMKKVLAAVIADKEVNGSFGGKTQQKKQDCLQYYQNNQEHAHVLTLVMGSFLFVYHP